MSSYKIRKASLKLAVQFLSIDGADGNSIELAKKFEAYLDNKEPTTTNESGLANEPFIIDGEGTIFRLEDDGRYTLFSSTDQWGSSSNFTLEEIIRDYGGASPCFDPES